MYSIKFQYTIQKIGRLKEGNDILAQVLDLLITRQLAQIARQRAQLEE